MPPDRRREDECDQQMDEMVETVAPQAENARHQTYRSVVNIPASRWYSRWQWNAHSPGLLASNAITTRRPGVTSTVSRTAPGNRFPSISTTWNSWPCRCIGCGIFVWLIITSSTRSPLAIGNGGTSLLQATLLIDQT